MSKSMLLQDCSGTCPIDAAGNWCGGHGNCSLTDGLCSCEPGWAGEACDLQCPGNINSVMPVQPCTGHGVCLQDAVCSCVKGYFNASCDGVCPGFHDHLGACSGSLGPTNGWGLTLLGIRRPRGVLNCRGTVRVPGWLLWRRLLWYATTDGVGSL